MNNRYRLYWVWVLPALLVAGLLAARMLNADILFVDEYWSIRNSGGMPFGPLDLAGIWERTATVDPGGMGVLYHWILHVWYLLLGDHPFSLRLLSLFAGLLSIAFTYRLGAGNFGRRAGVYGAIILAGSAFFIDYMHEARAYTLIALFSVTAIWLKQRIDRAESPPHAGWYIALALNIAALAYTHYVALALGAMLGLHHLLRFRRSRRWWWTLLAIVAGGLLFLPWLGITLHVVSVGAQDVNRQANSMDALAVLAELFYGFSSANIALLILLLIAGVARRRGVLLIWLWLLGVSLLVMIVNARIPFMVHLRYLMPVWPALALIAGLGLDRLVRHPRMALIAVMVWLGIGAYQTLDGRFIDNLFGQVYRAPADGFQRALDTLDTRATQGDMILMHIMPRETAPFALYPMGYYFDGFGLPYDQIERMNESFAESDAEYLRDVEASIGDARSLWTLIVPELPMTNRGGVVERVIDERYAHCQRFIDRDDMHLDLYTRPPDSVPELTFVHSEAPDGAIGFQQLREAQQVDALWGTALGWTMGAQVPGGTYNMALHLDDGAGTLLRQFDAALPAQGFGCVWASLDLSGLPAGDYPLYLIVYNWQTGDRLPGGADALDRVPLGIVRVE